VGAIVRVVGVKGLESGNWKAEERPKGFRDSGVKGSELQEKVREI
jgi:hypothetical protein